MATSAIDHSLLHPTASKFFTEPEQGPDYSYVPSFIKQGIDTSKITQEIKTPTEEEKKHNAVAYVSTEDPYKINVLNPRIFDSNDRNHELTHTYQNTRNKNIEPSLDPDPQDPNPYDYGGIKGLQEARKNKQTISDFNYEQQADIVKDYKKHHDEYLKKAASGKITPAEEKKMYDLQQVYHPFIRQLADMPGKKEDLDRSPLLELLGIQKPAALSRQPEPPGLPSYDTPGLGVLPADTLMGGKSQDISNQSKILHKILNENLGLSKVFNSDNTSVVFANPERSKRGLKERGGLEFWSPTEEGDKSFPHPSPGKNVLEIYDDKLKNNPSELKRAIYGDLMHGMNQDSYWKNLRDQFMQSFTPQEIKRQEQHKTWWDDVNGSKDKNGPTYDAYLRGWITNEGEGKRGQKESGNTMYSPRQIQLLQQMQEYLKTGKSQNTIDHSKLHPKASKFFSE